MLFFNKKDEKKKLLGERKKMKNGEEKWRMTKKKNI